MKKPSESKEDSSKRSVRMIGASISGLVADDEPEASELLHELVTLK